MKNFEGYLKRKLGDSYVLLAGGGHKALTDFVLTASNHNHDDRYITSLSINGDYLRYTKNSTNNDLTISYASYAKYLKSSYSIGNTSWSWNPLNVTSQTYVWGLAFKDTDIGSDTGNIRLYLTEEGDSYVGLAINIDGHLCSTSKVYAGEGFVKGSSSDSYVLLGGGGHKLLTEFKIGDYLPLSGGVMTGLIQGNTGNGIEMRSNNTGPWKEGLRIYSNETNLYSVLSLQSTDSKYIFAMVLNSSPSAPKYYFDVCVNGTNYTINMPLKAGTIALTNDITWANVLNKPFEGSTYWNGYNTWNWNPFNVNQDWIYNAWGFRNTSRNSGIGSMRFYITDGAESGSEQSLCVNIDGFISTCAKMFATNGFVKGSVGDTNVLLAGGGDKALTDFAMTSDYYNKTTSDNRYVNIDGDSMTGKLLISTNSSAAEVLTLQSTGAEYNCIAYKALTGGLNWSVGIRNDLYYIWNSSLGHVVDVLNNGNVGIGKADPSYKLDISGDARATNFRGNLIGNADSARLLKVDNCTSTGFDTWKGSITSYTKVWGQYFTNTSISSDGGSFGLFLRASEYSNGYGECCVMVDGDFYANGGSKVWHAGNLNKSTVDLNCRGLSTWGSVGNTNNYSEGIRIHAASNNWTSIVFCGTDNTGNSGTSAKTWAIGNKEGFFSINKNGGGTNHTKMELVNYGGRWVFGNLTAPYTSTNCHVEIYNDDNTGDALYLGTTSSWCTVLYKSANSAMWSVGSNDSVGFQFWNSSISTQAANISNAGALWCRSTATATNFYTSSDRNKKKNISPFSEHISKFTLKETNKDAYGVIAQEVPEMFREGKEGNMTVNYNSVLSYYVGCLENKVKDLEEKVKQLENLNK